MAEEKSDNRKSETDEKSQAKETQDKSIVIVSYPKIVFLYPSVLFAVGIASWMTYAQGLTAALPTDPATIATSVLISKIFLAVLLLNLVVISFDFPRTTSLTLFFLVTSVALVLFLIFSNNPDWLPVVGQLLGTVKPYMNAQFYWCYVGIFLVMFILVKLSVQFDYWELRPNELLHHHGILSDLKRYPAPRMRVDKEINDLFEFALMRSGRLILYPNNESQSIVLENVPFINRKEREVIRLLGALKVQIREPA